MRSTTPTLRFVSLLGLALAALGSTAAATRDEAVYARAEHYQPEVVRLLERLVNIDTGTGQDQGLAQVVDILTAELRQLGAKIELVTSTPMAGQNVVATFTGTGKGRILLVAHMDTVFRAGTAAERPFRITDGRAYGPGALDDKGGIVTALHALKILHDLGYKDFATITLMLNTNEEVGSIGSRRLIDSLARQHDIALNLEAGRPGDKLVVWRKGGATIELTVKGRASHAGNAPELGRNAAVEAAHQALQLGQLADPAKLTTVNVTVIQAGDRTNVIPDAAVVKADVRAVTPEDMDKVEQGLAEMIKHQLVPETVVTAKLVRGFAPLQRNSATDALVTKAQAVYRELGRTLGTEGAGGAADSSITAAAGTPSLDGLGLVGAGGHGPDEYVELASITPRCYLLTRLLMEWGAGR